MSIYVDTLRYGDETYTGLELEACIDDQNDMSVTLYDPEDEYPFAVMSVRLPQQPADGCFWLKDWSENDEIARQLIDEGYIELTGATVRTGFVVAKEARLIPDKEGS